MRRRSAVLSTTTCGASAPSRRLPTMSAACSRTWPARHPPVLPEFDRADLRRQIEDAYGASVAGILPLSDDLVRLASGGIFSVAYPDHPWSGEIRAVADTVLS